NDCGVNFSEKGFNTTVIFDGNANTLNKINEEVLIYDTDSRSLDANKAYNRVYNIGEKLIGLGVPIIQKKIDSTFRGNIGAETQALIDLGEYDIALIIPGNPSLGRQTINGIHYINNKKKNIQEENT